MNNITVRRYSDELYHHGIMGQKWGIRRYQNPDGSYTAAGREHYGIGSERKSGRQIKRRLNDLDQARAYNVRDREFTGVRERRHAQKAFTLAAKAEEVDIGTTRGLNKWTRIQAKIAKNASKADKYAKERQTAEDRIKKAQEETEALLKEASDLGYTVNSIPVRRLVNKGQDWLGPVDYYVQGVQYGVKQQKESKQNDTKKNPDKDEMNVSRESGKLYNSKYKNSEESSREWYTKEERTQKLKTAKENDRYDMYFLEAIQNSKIEYNNDKSARDREYAKYLEDPDDYFKNKSRKLEQA